MSNMSINTFLRRWDAGEFDQSRESMCEAGWYDWFCQDKGLYNRLKKMVPAIRRIARSPKVDADKMYVFFKNNCPMWVDTTYDDFRICDLETGNVLYTIIPRYPCPHQKAQKRRARTLRDWSNQRDQKQGYVCEVWDNIADEDELHAIHMENLAQGRAVDDIRSVVYGTRKEMYAYFGV